MTGVLLLMVIFGDELVQQKLLGLIQIEILPIKLLCSDHVRVGIMFRHRRNCVLWYNP